MINYDDFAKVEIKAGKILSAEKIPDTEKLLKLKVDFNEKNPEGIVTPRQIVSGISMYFPDPATLVGRTCMFVTNLEPRTIKGHESNGMLFAVSTPGTAAVLDPEGKVVTPAIPGNFSLLEPNDSIPPGTQAC